jgi:hypothetical protein
MASTDAGKRNAYKTLAGITLGKWPLEKNEMGG